MAGERWSRIVDELAIGAGHQSSAHLCEASRRVIGMTGTGVMLLNDDVPQGTMCASDAVSGQLEELQFTLGEGPCIDAYEQREVVAEPDLARPAVQRWLAFSSQAVKAGAAAVFAFPLHVGGVRLGVLDLYRDRPGPLRGEQHADALVVADVMARWVLDVQTDATPGAVAEQLELGSDFHYVVHNAAGMVSVQLGITITEALIRLRAYAYSHDRRLRDVARDVIDRRLRLD